MLHKILFLPLCSTRLSNLFVEVKANEAAEAEFLEKGYDGAKMLSIARRAGVAHSMLHYYYRSKENLFQAFMLRKTREIVPLFRGIFEQGLSFEETLNRLREARDRYLLSQVSQMPYFLLSEMLLKPENRAMVIGLLDRVESIQRVKKMLEAEIEASRIRPIAFSDFLFMLLTFDTASLTSISACREKEELGLEIADKLMASYREHNLQLILEVLRP